MSCVDLDDDDGRGTRSIQSHRHPRFPPHSGMGMGIHQTGHDVSAWQSLSSGDRLSDQAPGRVHPQVNPPVTIWQLHRAGSGGRQPAPLTATHA